MKFFDDANGLEGHVILVEEDDLKRPLDLPELKGEWAAIRWEGVFKRDGLYHAIYLTNNEFALEFLIPDAAWIPEDLRASLEAHSA